MSPSAWFSEAVWCRMDTWCLTSLFCPLCLPSGPFTVNAGTHFLMRTAWLRDGRPASVNTPSVYQDWVTETSVCVLDMSVLWVFKFRLIYYRLKFIFTDLQPLLPLMEVSSLTETFWWSFYDFILEISDVSNHLHVLAFKISINRILQIHKVKLG